MTMLQTVAVSVVASVVATLLVERLKRKTRRVPGFKAHRMSKWVMHNGVLWTQGITADPSKTIQDQTREVLGKLEAILVEAGVPKETNLIQMTIFLADLPKEFALMNEIYDAWVGPLAKPTRLCVQAALDSGCKIEIRATAAL